MPEEPIKPVGKLTPVNPNEIKSSVKPVGKLTPVGETATVPLLTEWSNKVSPEQDIDGALEMIKKSSRRNVSDSDLQTLKDVLINPQATEQQRKDAIGVIQGYAPEHKEGFINYETGKDYEFASRDYYLAPDKNGVLMPKALKYGEKPPKGFNVASDWGTQQDANDDSWYTDITKGLANGVINVAKGIAATSGVIATEITGEDNKRAQSISNALESLKFVKDEDLKATMYNSEGVNKWADLIDKKRFDFSPKALWGTFNSAVESLSAFGAGAGLTQSAFLGSFLAQISDDVDAAKDAGLKGRDAASMALLKTSIKAGLDASFGIEGMLFRGAAKEAEKGILKQIAKTVEKDAVTGLITEQGFKQAAKELVPQYTSLIKEALKDTGKEMLQESAQEFTDVSAEQLWDKLSDADKAKFGSDVTSPKAFARYLDSFINSAGMAPMAAKTAKDKIKYEKQSIAAYDAVRKGGGNVAALKKNLELAKDRGELTDKELEQANFKIDAYNTYNEQTKDLDLDDKEKKDAFELSFNIEAIKSEIPTNKEELDALDPIALAKIDNKKELVKGMQKQLNDMLLPKTVEKETKVGQKTAETIVKNEEKKKTTPTAAELLAKMGGIKSVEGDVDLEEEDVVEAETPDKIKEREDDFNKPTLEFNKMANENPTKAKSALQHKLKTEPNNQMQGIIRKAQNGRYTLDIGDNKNLRFAQSVFVEGKDNYFKHANLPNTEVIYSEDERGRNNAATYGGDTNMQSEGELMGYYKEPVVVKRIEFEGVNSKTGNPMIKAVLPVYNEQSGKFIGYIQEHKYGKSDYSKDEKVILGKIIDSNLYDEGLKEYAHIPNREVKVKKVEKKEPAKKVKEVDFDKLAAKAVNEKELDAIIDQADAAEYPLDFDAVNVKRQKLIKEVKAKEEKKQQQKKEADDKKQEDKKKAFARPNIEPIPTSAFLSDAQKDSLIAQGYDNATIEKAAKETDRILNLPTYEAFLELKDKGIFNLGIGEKSAYRPDLGLDAKQYNATLKQLEEGKLTKTVEKLLDFVDDIKKTGEVRSIGLTGGKSIKIRMPLYLNLLGEKANAEMGLTEIEEKENLEKQEAQKQYEETLQKPKANAEKTDVQKVVERMQKSLPKFKISYDEKLNAAGKIKGNEITINPYYAGKDTPIHEAGHALIDFIGYSNKVIQKGIEQLKSTDLWKETKERYPELNDEQLGKEVLAEAIGREGADIFDTEIQKTRFKQVLDYIFDWLKRKLGLEKNVAKSLAKQIISGVGTKNVQAVVVKEGKKVSFQMPSGEKVDGKEVQVDVVNGFYSNLEKQLLQIKLEKIPAKQWADKLKGEEAKWTGLTDWLSQQTGSVSKADIQQFLKDNRIQVVEVVKDMSEQKMITSSEENYLTDTLMDDYDYLGMASVFDAKEAIVNNENWVEKYNITDKKLIKIGNKYRDSINAKKGGTPKFETYQLEGEKENYKEVLVTMPKTTEKANYEVVKKGDLYYPTDQVRNIPTSPYSTFEQAKAESDRLNKGAVERTSKDTFKSSHFDEPNILVHLRMNTRTDSEGNKVLFLEEVQSDWGQKGKKEGFKSDEAYQKADDAYGKYLDRMKAKYGKDYDEYYTKEESDEEYTLLGNRDAAEKAAIPQAPFVTDTNAWTKLGLKVALKEAVAQGATKIAWTTGEQQVGRYEDDFRKQVDKIETYKRISADVPSVHVIASKGSSQVFDHIIPINGKTIVSGKEVDLEDVVGKEIANKIRNSEEKQQSFEGDALTIGGKGMEDFYGKPSDAIRSKSFTIKKEGELFAVKDEKGKTIRTFKQENEANKFKENYGLGIVGNVAKSLFKQEPKTVTIKGGKGSIDATSVDAIWVEYNGIILPENKREDYKFNDNEFVFTIDNNVAYRLYDKNDIKDAKNRDVYTIPRGNYFTQHSIDITPELIEQVGGGLPMFQKPKKYKELEDLTQSELQRKITKTFEGFRTDVLKRDLTDIRNMLIQAKEGIADEETSEDDKIIYQQVIDALKLQEKRDKSKWMAYKEDKALVKELIDKKPIADMTVEELVEAYNLLTSGNISPEALGVEFSNVKKQLAYKLFTERKEELKKYKNFVEQQANVTDLKPRDVLMKTLSHMSESFPELQKMGTIFDNAYFDMQTDRNDLKTDLEKLGKDVIKERNKQLGIKDRVGAFTFSNSAKYFDFVEHPDGRYYTLEEAKQKGFTEAQTKFLKFMLNLNKLRNEQLASAEVVDDVLKVDKSVGEAFQTEGLMQAFSSYLGNGFNIKNVVIDYNGKKMPYGEVEKDLMKQGEKGTVDKAVALAKMLKYNFKARRQLKTGVGADNEKINTQEAAEYQLSTDGQLRSKFNKSRGKDRSYSKDFYHAAFEFIDDYTHVKHMNPIMPYINSIEELNKSEFEEHAAKPNVVKWIKEWKDLHLFKQKKVGQLGPEIDVALKTLRKISSATTMFFNLPANAWNVAMGTYNNIRSEAGKDVAIGSKRLAKDWIKGGKAVDILNKYQVVSIDKDSNPKLFAGRIMDQLGYMFNRLGETYIQGSMFLGQMTDEEFNSFEYKTDEYGVKKLVLKDPSKEKELREKFIRYKNRVSDIQGKYAEKDMRNFTNSEFGKAIGQYKIWLPDAVKERFGERYIDRNGVEHIGSYRAMFGQGLEDLRAEIKEKGMASLMNSNSTEAKAFRTNLKGAMVLGVLFSLKAAADDDDEEAAIIDKALGQILFIFDPHQLKFTISNPVPAVGVLNNFLNVLDDAKQGKFEKAAKGAGKLVPMNKVIIETEKLLEEE